MAEYMVSFTAGEAQRLVGVDQYHLRYWDKTAVVQPHGRAASGSGSRRFYTMLDVVQLKVVRRLREEGLSLAKIRTALKFIRDLPDEPAPLAELEIATDGRRIFVRRSDDAVIDVLAHQYVLRLPLADLLAEVQAGVAPSSFIGVMV